MQVSLKPRIELRTKIGRIAAAVGFAVLIGSFAAGPVRADGDDHRGGNRDRGSDQHRDNDNRGYRGGNNYYAYQQPPDYYYYNPQPNYYAAPDPYYYGSDRSYSAPPPGVSLFFGL
jgi:hypothetical protein